MAKRLVLMHGAPGSGKSTFIKKLGLEYLTISADTIRLLFSEPEVMVVDNHSCMQFSRKYDKEVWELIFKALEERMKNGSNGNGWKLTKCEDTFSVFNKKYHLL